MSKPLFRAGGRLNMQKTGPTTYTGTLTIEAGKDGMVARACSDEACTPRYFRVKLGTGLTGLQEKCYCPYCATAAEPNSFTTKAQIDYAKALLFEEAKPGLNQMFKDVLKLDANGERTLGGGFISIEMKMDPLKPRPLSRPVEEELRRDVICPHCGLVHAVFGLAFACPDCGEDIFLAHVREELGVLSKILGAVPERGTELGQRVAARDVENALEDVVSIFECVMKLVTRRALANQGKSPTEIDAVLRSKVRNKYQSTAQGAEVYKEMIGAELFAPLSPVELQTLTDIFEKRHPITHNLGIIDRKYLERATTHALEGQELRVTAEEVQQAIGLVDNVISRAYQSTGADVPSDVSTLTAAPVLSQSSASNAVLEGLTSEAIRVAEYLIRHSDHGLDRDPTVALGELAATLNLQIHGCRVACRELEAREWIWEDAQLINSDWDIGPKPALFQSLDRVWLGSDPIADAFTVVEHLLANADAGLAIAAFAETLQWAPRRMNPALEHLAEHGAVELGPYGHPYVAHWMRENENTQVYFDLHKK